MLLPKKGTDGVYHVEGELKIVKKSTFRDLFSQALQVIKEVGDITVFLTVPLPQYLLERCCTDPTAHISNKYAADYESNMRVALADIADWMKSMCQMRRLKNVVIYNPMEPLGLLDNEADEEQILQLWGMDPVHPTEAAYKAIGDHLTEMIVSHMAEARIQAAAAAEESIKTLRLRRWPGRNR
jgi:lysophospholipase L1-like esterase